MNIIKPDQHEIMLIERDQIRIKFSVPPELPFIATVWVSSNGKENWVAFYIDLNSEADYTYEYITRIIKSQNGFASNDEVPRMIGNIIENDRLVITKEDVSRLKEI